MLAEPDDIAVSREHPVLALEGNAALRCACNLLEDAVAIVGMEDLRQQLAVPVLGRVTKHRLDLRADGARIVAVADSVHPGHEREAVCQVSVLAVGFGQLLLRPTLLAQAVFPPALKAPREQTRRDPRRQREHRRDYELLGEPGDEEERHGDSCRHDQDGAADQPRARGERPRLQHWTG